MSTSNLFSAAVDGDTIFLHLHRGASPRTASASDTAGLPREIGGQPVSYLWKDVAYPYVFEHPVTGLDVPINLARIDHWIEQFNAMSRNGVTVPIVDDHKVTAAANNGKVVRMKREGDTLFALYQLIGPEAARKGATNEASVGIKKELKDGKGNTYHDALEHVALTPVPVIPGQSNATVAASRNQTVDPSAVAATERTPIVTAAANTAENAERNPAMDDITNLPCSSAHMAMLHAHVPGLKECPNDQKMAHLCGHLMSRSVCMNRIAGVPADTTLSRKEIDTKAEAQIAAWEKSATIDLPALRQQLAERDGQITNLARQVPKALDSDSESALLDTAEIEFNQLVREGSITPPVRDGLLSLARTSDGKANTLVLSRAANPAGNKSLILAVAAALRGNKPVEIGEKTGIQELSRTVPGREQAGSSGDVTKRFMELATATETGTKL